VIKSSIITEEVHYALSNESKMNSVTVAFKPQNGDSKNAKWTFSLKKCTFLEDFLL